MMIGFSRTSCMFMMVGQSITMIAGIAAILNVKTAHVKDIKRIPMVTLNDLAR